MSSPHPGLKRYNTCMQKHFELVIYNPEAKGVPCATMGWPPRALHPSMLSSWDEQIFM
jgi:hypothetical protein